MHAPTTAVVWEVWRRHRWVLVASTVWFVAVAVVCHVLSEQAIFGPDAVWIMSLFGISPLLCGLLPLFAYGCDADLAGKNSIFPARMFTLPLSTRALVGWPMLYGTVATAAAWLAVATLVLRLGGGEVALIWPAALLAACLAWVQAMAWRPFGLVGMRIVASVAPIGVLVAISSLRWIGGLPEAIVALALAGTIAPAYLVAVAGVARARRGDQPERAWVAACATVVADRLALRGREFRTWSHAQTWFEWRRHGITLPITVALMLLFACALVAVARHNPHLAPDSMLRSPLLLLAVPLVAAVVAGGNWGVCGQPGSAIPAFLATRPMSCAGLVWAKMKAAALDVAMAWGLAIAAFVLMIVLTGSWSELARQWQMLTGDFSTAQRAAVVTLAVFLLPAATWKPMVSQMVWGLAGRNWVWLAGGFAISAIMVAAIPIGCWLSMHPEYRDDLVSAMPWAIVSAAALKLAIGGWAVRALWRRSVLEARWVATLLRAWLAVAASLAALFSWLVPSGLAPWYLVTACVVLAMPTVRISLAPLALAWNRHR